MKVSTILATFLLSSSSCAAIRRHRSRMLSAVDEGSNAADVKVNEEDDYFIIPEETAVRLGAYEVPDRTAPSSDEEGGGPDRHLVESTALIGLIDGPNSPFYHTDYLLRGWACQLGDPEPVTVQLYVFGPPGTHGAAHVKDIRADVVSEGGISSVCRTYGKNYRFEIPIEYEDALSHGGLKMYVVGVSTRDTKNTVLGHSGIYTVPSIPDSSVAGFMDGYFPDEEVVKGWACQTDFVAPIEVQLYVGGPKDQGGIFIRSVMAQESSEETISTICKTYGRGYRFIFPISELELKIYQGQPIFVYGISSHGTPDRLLSNSGTQTFPHYYPIEAFNIRGSAIVNKVDNTMHVALTVEEKK